jgi:hypothetical protein
MDSKVVSLEKAYWGFMVVAMCISQGILRYCQDTHHTCPTQKLQVALEVVHGCVLQGGAVGVVGTTKDQF